MSNYSPLDKSLYEIKRGTILFKLKGTTFHIDLGDANAFALNLAATFAERKRKNGPLRTLAIRVPNEVNSTVTFTLMQKTAFARAAAVMSLAQKHTQSALADGEVEFDAHVGFHDLGYHDIDVVGIETTTGTWVEGTHYNVVDPEMGFIEVLVLPSGVIEGDKAKATFTATAVTEEMNRMSADIGTETELTGELIVREVGKNGIASYLRLWEVTIAPAGDVSFIDEDDFSGLELTGAAVDTARGIGIWRDLKKAA